MNSFNRAITRQIYLHQGYYIKAEAHLACDHDLNISLYVSGKGTKKMVDARGGGTWVNP